MKREESPEETLARLGVRVLPPPPNGAHHGKVNRRNGGSPPQPTTTFASPSKQPNVELVLAEAIEPTPIDWLWDGWLAKGKLQVLAGQPGTGKTTLAIALAAITSIGGVWPDGSQATAGNVVIWSGEDDPADTLVPRLIAAGADRSRIYFVKGVSKTGGSAPLILRRTWALFRRRWSESAMLSSSSSIRSRWWR